MKFSTIVAAAAAAVSFTSVDAYGTSKKPKRTFGILGFGGGDELTRCRLDPIVNPDGIAGHMHSIFGGNAFSASMPGDTASSSSCTTAKVKKDRSNYWVPSLYFKSPENGTLYPVPLHYAQVYYFFDATNDDIKAFPKGFRMRSGDPSLRAPPSPVKGNDDPSNGPVTAVKWTCPRSDEDKARAPALYPTTSDGTKGCGVQDPNNGGEGWGFPDKECSGFASPLRADIHFPSCVNPNVDIENWKENTAFPTDNGAWGKDCPEGWIHIPHIFVEVYWNTPLFKDMWTQGQGTQPFVLSNGDTTGYSLHADFINGWDSTILQGLIDTCDAGHAGLHTCLPESERSTEEEMKNCKLKCPLEEAAADKFWSPMPNNKLFGNNELSGYQPGPYVAPNSGSSSVAVAPKPASSSAQVPRPSTTFAYVNVPAANDQPVATPAPVYEPQPVVENHKVVIITTQVIRTKKVIKTVIVPPAAQTVAAAAAPEKSCDKPRRRRARHIGRHHQQHGSF